MVWRAAQRLGLRASCGIGGYVWSLECAPHARHFLRERWRHADGERTYAATEEPDWHDIAGVIDALRGSESTGGLMWHDPSGTALPPRGTPVLWSGLASSQVGRSRRAVG